jgi:hypothetical protein
MEPEDRQYPAVLLLTRSGDSAKGFMHRVVKDANGKESVEMDFNWSKLTIGGVPLNTIAEKRKATQFQLNVFEYDSGKRVPSASMGKFEPIDDKDRKLSGIDLDTVLRADIDFKLGAGTDAPDGKPVTFVVLFKKAKEIQKR